MVATTNAVAKVAAVVAGLGLVAMSFASFAPAAKAMTANEIAAQIAALQAQLAALSGGSSSASATFTMDLTIGSTGSEVTALQNWLISKGHSIPAGATGYFGAQTQSALAAWQAANGVSPAAGYFGPITRAKINAMGGGTTGGSTGGSTGLSGGAGSVDDYKLLSSPNNEKVGEDQEDVEVATLEIEADRGSDLKLTALRIVFDEGTAGSDFEDYADEVSVWFDGEEVARVDADEFNDDNDWTKTVSLKDAILKRGDTADLTIAVSGARSIDSADLGDTWTVDFRQIRFVDAQGATISEDPNTATRTFSFESYANAGNVELKIAEDDRDVNNARTIEVDATDDTDNVPVMSFTLQAKGNSDLEIRNWGVSVTVTGAANTDDVISGLSLWIDGDEVASAETVSGGGASADYRFEKVNYTIDAGDTVDAEIRADFLSIADALDEGDTISFALGEEQTDTASLVRVRDESGENLGDSDISGSVNAGPFALRSAGILVTFVSASESITTGQSANDDVGTFRIVYNVAAFGDTVYVSNDAAATVASSIADESISTDGILYVLEQGGTATVPDTGLSSAVTFKSKSGVSETGGHVRINEGRNTDFTLTVAKTNSNASPAGLYRVLLRAIGWNTDNSSTYNVYDFDLEDYKTDYQSLN